MNEQQNETMHESCVSLNQAGPVADSGAAAAPGGESVDRWPTERHCFLCGAGIFECMGSVLGRDFLMWSLGRLAARKVRELCGRCALQQSETGYCDIPPMTDEEKEASEL